MKAKFLFILFAIFLMAPREVFPQVHSGCDRESASKSTHQSEEKEQASPYPLPVTKGNKPTESDPTFDQQAKQIQKESESYVSPFGYSLKLSDTLQILLNFLLVVVTIGLGWIAYRQNKSIHTVERAYLNVSPFPPSRGRRVTVEIKNYGETPATITAIAMHCGKDLPPDPKDPGDPDKDFSRHYLVRNEYFFHSVDWSRDLGVTPDFVFGYVDYTTEFGEYRRFGFARKYDTIAKRFVFVSEHGWSYDEKR